MSHLWLDQYIAVLGPERVAIVRRRRGWNGAFDLKADAPCGAPTAAAAAQALAGLLADARIGKGELTLVLSNHFVRYFLVPWHAELSRPSELAAYAQICCDEIYGGEATRRVLTISRERGASPRLAAALEAPWLEQLRAIAAASKLKLVSIQPYLAAAVNRLGRAFLKGDFLFVLAEPARSCLLGASGGRWSCVRSSAAEDRPQAVSELIEREAQLLGLHDGGMPPIYVHAPRQAHLKLAACHGVTPQALNVPIPAALAAAADPLLAMAMVVA